MLQNLLSKARKTRRKKRRSDSRYRPVVEGLEQRRVLSAVSFAAPVLEPLDSEPRAVVSADLDGDGHVDLATANDFGSVSILWNTGDGGFAAANDQAVASRARSLTASDFDGDGDIDLATAHYKSIQVDNERLCVTEQW